MTDGPMTTELARSRNEGDRAGISAQLLEPYSRQLLNDAGLKPGMRVLDVLSGAGEFALLAREFVGDDGHVTGFDTSVQAVAYANDRSLFRNARNMDFVEADIDDLRFGRDFDAIIGRAVLGYRRDPVSDVKSLVRYLRPGGLMIFQDFDHSAGRTIPRAPLVEEVRGWFLSAFDQAGVDVEMGAKLHSMFETAGLPPPRMRLDGLIGGASSAVPMLLVNVIRMLLPQLEALEIASAEEVSIDTLEERIRLELMATGSIMQGSLFIGAWTRIPV